MKKGIGLEITTKTASHKGYNKLGTNKISIVITKGSLDPLNCTSSETFFITKDW